MISGPADVINARPATGAFARFADRWVYVFMAGLFILTALAGFIPDSVAILTEVRAHARPPLPLVMHMHALLMGSWLLLLFAQTLLMATGRRPLHRKIGAMVLLLVPLILVTMVCLVRIGFELTTPCLISAARASACCSALRRVHSLGFVGAESGFTGP
jgi:hypothetical protein